MSLTLDKDNCGWCGVPSSHVDIMGSGGVVCDGGCVFDLLFCCNGGICNHLGGQSGR